MPNQLANEISPYLLQHKDNPVDWYPWCEEAFERAKAEDKPIFLSIGYSSCHWCHVMAHESFEDPTTAEIMNRYYINIKVDREERPDVDSIYMNAVQALTGRGGWPLSVWLLPDGRPFFGGTYFPKEPRYGMPSFKQVLLRIAELFHEQRDRLEEDAMRLTQTISGHILLDGERGQTLDASLLDLAFQTLAERYDTHWGGFGEQPKFPPSMTLELLLRLYHRRGWQHALQMVTHTLDRMMWGGMYDQIGGGFHRYAVDRMWLIPHFEKMLYDNALLARIYLHAYQVTGQPRYRRVVEETLGYIRREMTAPQGGFYSAQDADSEGEEGRFFIWTEAELRAALEDLPHSEAMLDYWGVKQGANFEGRYVLWVPEPPEHVAARHGLTPDDLLAEVERARARLFERREQRVKPGCDDKILTAWNGLMINTLAQAGRVLEQPLYTEMAARAAEFILSQMRRGERLLRAYRHGRARLEGYLEDYALLTEGLIELYQSTFDLRWFREALALTEHMLALFWDDRAGFFDTAHDHESLITRPQEVTDNAIPAGTSGAVAVLVRMALYTGRTDWHNKAERVLERLAGAIVQYPHALSYLAAQMDFMLAAPHEIALVGEPTSREMNALLEAIRKPYRPNQVVALRRPDDGAAADLIPLLAGREMVNGKATAYVCRRFACRLPVTTPNDLQDQLDAC